MGKSDVEIAPYTVLVSASTDPVIEIRRYDQLVLVSAPMKQGMHQDRGSAFGLLFDYISGANTQQSSIDMTAPVFMQQSEETKGKTIPMTAPVIMQPGTDEQPGGVMSFVLPQTYQLATAPVPTHEKLTLSNITDYTVAAIIFNGRLKESNITEHDTILREWIQQQDHKIIGSAQVAGYNPPFTLPALRRNEVLIPIEFSK